MNHESTLEELLNEKDFDQLTEQEKNQVLSTMERSEYDFERQLILASQSVFDQEESELTPDPRILQEGRQAVATNHTEPIGFFQHKIPTWMAVAALLLLLFTVVPLKWFGTSNSTEINTPNLVEVEAPSHRFRTYHGFAFHLRSAEEQPVQNNINTPKLPQDYVEQETESPRAEEPNYPDEMFAFNAIDLTNELQQNKSQTALSMANDTLGKWVDAVAP